MFELSVEAWIEDLTGFARKVEETFAIFVVLRQEVGESDEKISVLVESAYAFREKYAKNKDSDTAKTKILYIFFIFVTFSSKNLKSAPLRYRLFP